MREVSERKLTFDPDLVRLAVWAGQQRELFSLVHGIICAGHHNPILRPPAHRLLCKIQDTTVQRHVHRDRDEGTDCRHSRVSRD